jgi:hypothetical protein
MSSHDVDAIADAIERYVTQHPEAADSVEGICAWWLSSQHGADAVLAALVQLEARGIVVRTERQGVATIFSGALRGRGSEH